MDLLRFSHLMRRSGTTLPGKQRCSGSQYIPGIQVPSCAVDDIEMCLRPAPKPPLRQRAIGLDKAAGNRPKANTTVERPSEFVTHCLHVGIPRFVK